MRPRPGRFLFTVVLAMTMGTATVALTCYSVLAPDLIAEFGVARWQIGALVTAMSFGGALMSPRVGRVADVMGAKRATTTTIVLGASALTGLALAPRYWLVVAAALVGGLAQAMGNPATNKLIALHVEPGRRGVVTGIKQSGVTAASALGGAVLPPVALAAGWRWAVAVFVVLAIVAGGLSLLVPPDPGGDTVSASAARPPLDPYIFRIAAYGFALGAAGTAVFTFLPLFAVEVLGRSPAEGGLAVAVVGVAGVVGRIAWARVAELRLGTYRSLEYIAALASLTAGFLLLAPSFPWLLWVAAATAGLSASAWNAVGMLAVIQTVTPAQAGRASGVVLFGFLAGLGLGAPVFGFSIDRLGTYRPGWMAVGTLFLLGLGVMRVSPPPRSPRRSTA